MDTCHRLHIQICKDMSCSVFTAWGSYRFQSHTEANRLVTYLTEPQSNEYCLYGITQRTLLSLMVAWAQPIGSENSLKPTYFLIYSPIRDVCFSPSLSIKLCTTSWNTCHVQTAYLIWEHHVEPCLKTRGQLDIPLKDLTPNMEKTKQHIWGRQSSELNDMQ